MSAARLVAREVRFTNRAFWRNAAGAFFTFVFPLMFLVIFSVIFGGGSVQISPTRSVPTSTFYVPAISAFSVITACFTYIAMSVTFQREEGILKRLRGTPVPPRVYLTGRVAHAVLIALLLVAICVGFGAVFYGAEVPTALPAFVVTVLVGAAAFCALGLAITAAIPNADAASPIVNAAILPLMFFSNVFIPLEHPPSWVDVLGKIFPVRHFADAMQSAYFSLAGSGFRWWDLAVLAAWGIGGLILAIRFFSWEPRG
jgi:ABC-2 type transport system permease protein